MPKIRFTVSLEKDLLDEFDDVIQQRSYSNRSEAIRDLIRQNLIDQEWESGTEVIGNITMIYNHHERELARDLTHTQHDFNDVVISTQHIHIDHENCLEVIIVRGNVEEVTTLYNTLKATDGVKQCELVRSTTGTFLS